MLEDLKDLAVAFAMCLMIAALYALIGPLMWTTFFGGNTNWNDSLGIGLFTFLIFWIGFHYPSKKVD